MSINQKTLNLVKEYEGYHKELADGRCIAYLDRNATPKNPYYDHKAGGLWTIGYGATGPHITEGTIWTRAQAEKDLAYRLEQVAKQIDLQLHVKVNDNQRGALSSIGYNVGVYGIRSLIDRVNQDPDSAGPYFANYKYGTVDGHKAVLRGLVRRRTAERELYEWEDKKQLIALSSPMKHMQYAQWGIGGVGGAGTFLWNNWQQFDQMISNHTGVVILVALAVGYGACELVKWYFKREFDKGTYIPEGTKPVPTEEETEIWHQEDEDVHA